MEENSLVNNSGWLVQENFEKTQSERTHSNVQKEVWGLFSFTRFPAHLNQDHMPQSDGLPSCERALTSTLRQAVISLINEARNSDALI